MEGRGTEPCLIRSGSLAELCPIIMWKEQLVSHESGCLAEEYSKNVLKVQPDFFLVLIV